MKYIICFIIIWDELKRDFKNLFITIFSPNGD